VILPPTEKRVSFESFHEENLILALPRQHALATKKRIEITDLHQLPLIKIRGDIEPRFGKSLQLLLDLIRVRPHFFMKLPIRRRLSKLFLKKAWPLSLLRPRNIR
jgi:hypothetical protein